MYLAINETNTEHYRKTKREIVRKNDEGSE